MAKDERTRVGELKEKLEKGAKGKDLTLKEVQLMVKYPEEFIDPEMLKKIDEESEKVGKMLERACARNRNPRAWRR